MRIVLVILSFLFLPSVAQAQGLEKYERQAIAVWGQHPDCETIMYAWASDGQLGDNVGARAGGCRMWINVNYWQRLRPSGRCWTFSHEWGHLLGYDTEGDAHPVIESTEVQAEQGRVCNHQRPVRKQKPRWLLRMISW